MSEDERSEQPERHMATAKPITALEFEGSLVTELEGRLPAMTVDMAEGYALGTHVKLQVTVRVKNVRYEERRGGDMARQHIFALEEIALVGAYDPNTAVEPVLGSASAQGYIDDGTAADLPHEKDLDLLDMGGLEFGRTSDQWGA